MGELSKGSGISSIRGGDFELGASGISSTTSSDVTIEDITPLTLMPLENDLGLVLGVGTSAFSIVTGASYIDRLTGLIRFAVANQLIRSEEFDDAAWSKLNLSITPNSSISPVGDMTTDKIIPSAALNAKSVFQTSSIISGTEYTQSVFVRANGFDFIQIAASTGFGLFTNWVNIDLQSGTIGSFGVGAIGNVTIEPLPDNFFRVSLTSTATSTVAGGMLLQVLDSDINARLPAFSGDSASGVDMWGAQLAVGNRQGDYQSTLGDPGPDVARFESNGVLIEGDSTNQLLRSEGFNSTTWTKLNLTISADSSISPDGSTTAEALIPIDGDFANLTFQNSSVTTGLDYTQTLHAKPNGYDFVQIAGSTGFDSTNTWANFNLSNGTIGNLGSASIGKAKIESLASGWFRLSLTSTAISTTSGRLVLQVLDSDINARIPVFTADGVSGVDAWGAPLEQLQFSSSYVPTTTLAVTRAAGNLSIDAENIPAPANDYTVSIELDILGLDSTKTQTVYSVDGETSRKIEINTTTGLVEATHGAVTSTSTTALVAGTKFKIAFVIDGTNQTLYINGIQEDQDTKGTVTGTATAISIGNSAGSDQLFGHEDNFRIYEVALTPQQVAAL